MPLAWSSDRAALHQGDALSELSLLPDQSVSCLITSPPYFGLRDYGAAGQIGLEATPEEYAKSLREVFSEVRRVLTHEGTLWLNIGDSYNAYNANRGTSSTGFSRNDPLPQLPKGHGLTVKSLPNKSLLGIPWRVAFALQDDGWILRNSIVWHKPNAKPESVRDRMASSHELLFMFSKRARYWYDLATLKGAGRNPGDVWSVPTKPFRGAHFATMPVELAERCVKAGCPVGGVVLDPFSGSGTTGVAALNQGRTYVGIELKPEYVELSIKRLDSGA